jgi:hypothetical protein
MTFPATLVATSTSPSTPPLKKGHLPVLIASMKQKSGKPIDVRVMIDSGSQASFICRSLVNKLNLKETPVNEVIVGINGSSNDTQVTCVSTKLYSVLDPFTLPCRLRVIDSVAGLLPPFTVEKDWLPIDSTPRLTEPLERPACTIDVLLGQDYMPDILTDLPQGKRKLTLWHSKFGTCISGSFIDKCTEDQLINTAQVQTVQTVQAANMSNEELLEKMKEFWQADTLPSLESTKYTPDEMLALDQYHETTTFVKGRYITRLPFNPAKPKPENNYFRALACFNSLEKQLLRNSDLRKRYTDAINKYISGGFAERVLTETPSTDTNCYYLPHHSVKKETRKTRVVFNGSAEDSSGNSLNKALLPGPALQQDLGEILLRFRSAKIACIGDISDFFLCVGLAVTDRPWTRFLWKEPGSKSKPKVFQMCHICFGLASSPFLAIQTIQTHVRKYQDQYPETVKDFLANCFVDDYLFAVDTVEEAKARYTTMETILQAGGFHMAKWLSSDPAVQRHVPLVDRHKNSPWTALDAGIDETAITTKVRSLGLQFQSIRDYFEFDHSTELSLPAKKETMRTLASKISSWFDPLGLVAPYTLAGKLCLQRAWQEGLDWDDPLTGDLAETFSEWLDNIMYIHYLTIPRQLFIKNHVRAELHGFADASSIAQSASVYVRSFDELGNINVALAMSKSKVASLKLVSIPRMELVAALMLAKLMKKVSETLGIYDVVCWSDSITTLRWISKSPAFWKQFVAARVQKIQELYDIDKWKYVGTDENPADVGSRGANASRLIETSIWFKGPAYLMEMDEAFPQFPPEQPQLTTDVETRCQQPLVFVTTLEASFFAEMFGTQYHAKGLRILAYVRRFIFNCRNPDDKTTSITPTKSERIASEKTWARFIQQLSFPSELTSLKAKKQLTNSRLTTLQPYYDTKDDLLRVGGRLEAAPMSQAAKHPIVLPASNAHVQHMLLELHQAYSHCGIEQTLALSRNKFWILSGRRTVKSALRHCSCYRLRSRAFNVPVSNLPSDRLHANQCFSTTMMDYAGPFECTWDNILTIPATPLEEREPIHLKCWVLLFCCSTSRAIHLEVTMRMTTAETINAVKRMLARRGWTQKLYLDNQSSFRKMSKQYSSLWKAIDWTAVQEDMAHNHTEVEFHFLPAYTPWASAHERLIGVVKKALKATFAKSTPSFDTFNTATTCIEGVLNDRPLGVVSDDPSDPLPITPSKLMLGHTLSNLHDLPIRPALHTDISNLWRSRQKWVKKFWIHWQQDYINNLQSFPKWTKSGGADAKVGDVCLARSMQTNQLNWKLAIITDIYPSSDGRVRSVQLKRLIPGQKEDKFQQIFYKRSVRDLYKLETDSMPSLLSDIPMELDSPVPDTVPPLDTDDTESEASVIPEDEPLAPDLEPPVDLDIPDSVQQIEKPVIIKFKKTNPTPIANVRRSARIASKAALPR